MFFAPYAKIWRPSTSTNAPSPPKKNHKTNCTNQMYNNLLLHLWLNTSCLNIMFTNSDVVAAQLNSLICITNLGKFNHYQWPIGNALPKLSHYSSFIQFNLFFFSLFICVCAKVTGGTWDIASHYWAFHINICFFSSQSL